MHRTLSLAAVLVLCACASNPGAVTVESPSFDMLAGKCFTGYAVHYGRRTGLKLCFNADGNYAFYHGSRHDLSGNLQQFDFSAPVKISDHGRLVLESYQRNAQMKLSRSADGRLHMKGSFRYELEPAGSVVLTEGSAEQTRELQEQILNR